MSNTNGWLSEIVEGAARGDLLVVCRTSATVRAVHRALLKAAADSEAAGWAGVEVTTLPGLLAQAAAGRLGPGDAPEPDDLPTEHPWADRLAERGKLRRRLRRHVQRARACALAGRPVDGLRAEVGGLVTSSWQVDDSLAAAERVLGGVFPPSGTSVLAVGFGAADDRFEGAVSPLDRAMLRALGATHIDTSPAPPAEEPRLRAMVLPDVAAEARAAAALILGHRDADRDDGAAFEDGVVVLVSDAAEEERIRAALRRNGVATAADGAAPLSRHSLVALIHPLLPAFASRGMDPVRLNDLRRLLTSSVLSRRPPKSGIEPVPGIDQARASARRVHDLLNGCRRLVAPLSDWVAALEQLEAAAAQRHEDASDARRDSAAGALAAVRVVLARMRVLRTHAEGGGVLGSLAACLAELGLADPGHDRVGRAVIQSLWDAAHLPCDEEAFDDALTGAVSSGRVDLGVQILRYRHYDGRPSRLLLLAGVHDKGVARPPRPDPLLADADLALLDLPTPAEAVQERLDLVRWAAGRASEVIALCPETGADGRRVGLPVGLALAIDSSSAHSHHGLDLALPRLRDGAALGPDEEAAGDDHTARQIDAEWARWGAAFQDADVPEFDASTDPLSDYLSAFEDRLPDDLGPWLGSVGEYPNAPSGLPPRFVLSASRTAAFTQCLYRAFAQQVVGLKKREDVSEDLDSREIGNAVHATLERTMKAALWVVPDASLAAARADLLERLLRETGKAVEDVAAERPSALDTEPLRVARDAVVQRWERHWEHYVKTRVVSVAEANAAAAKSLMKRDDVFSARWNFVSDLFPRGPGRNTVRGQLFGGSELALIATLGDLDGLRGAAAILTSRIGGKKNAELVREYLAADPPRPSLVRLSRVMRAAIEPLLFAPGGDLQVFDVEHRFGRPWDQPEVPPLFVQLGRKPIEVRGYIDALVRRAGPSEHPSRLRIVDFKAGRGRPGSIAQVRDSLVRPQLAFYALATETLGDEFGTVGPPEFLEYDRVRELSQVEAPFDAAGLERARTSIGDVLDRGRDGDWPLLPHPDGCPIRNNGYGWCDVQDMCRMRPSFAPEDDR